ncbi:glycosyltransferase [Puniceicoccales bacterium CK1056]|uniref:Glycosyltransferase n=1 Tax=Oceanipulchritudo coccoides TaxID=2706888 RepID=A0A6B2M299_9BACT|nr:glycosyltransferase family 2 protein [Oceanipulchritudo coccoides]NDV62329.1 glycosyltransferase [Oceanipulchritudo coccoides]
MKISLCITTYNKPVQLEQVLSGIRRMSVLPDEVIVCDDGSGPETRSMLDRLKLDFPVPLRHLWQPDEGWQVSKSRNMGIKEAAGDYIVFIDGDCVPHHKFIEDHKQLAREGHFTLGDRAHVKQPYTNDFQPTFMQVMKGILSKKLHKRYVAIRNPLERPYRINYGDVTARELANLAVGCNMAFWKSDIVKINGFNESLEGWALEDIEMAGRLLVSGVTANKVWRQAILYHLDHGDPVFDDETILDSTESVLSNKVSWTPSGLSSTEEVS